MTIKEQEDKLKELNQEILKLENTIRISIHDDELKYRDKDFINSVKNVLSQISIKINDIYDLLGGNSEDIENFELTIKYLNNDVHILRLYIFKIKMLCKILNNYNPDNKIGLDTTSLNKFNKISSIANKYPSYKYLEDKS